MSSLQIDSISSMKFPYQFQLKMVFSSSEPLIYVAAAMFFQLHSFLIYIINS